MIAGETSGDRLGGALMDGLNSLRGDVSYAGIGGPEMAAAGLASRFDMSELSVMGIAEVLPKYRHLKRRIAETARAVIDDKPDVLITIDSPDFCLRVAKRVRAQIDLPVIHYVAPTVWAWRPGRADKMARVVDHVLALFPFEPPYMTEAGMGCDFVGHPVAAEPVPTMAEISDVRQGLGIEEGALCVLPGSRRGEVRRLAPIFGAALGRLADRPQVVLPAAPGLTGLLRELTADWPAPPVIVPAEEGWSKLALFAACRTALAASGTVSLELAAAGTPMVVAYDMNWLSRQIIGRMLRVDTVTLVNLVSETRAVPEFIGANCTPERIAGGLSEVMAAPDAQRKAMETTMTRLGRGGEAPGLRAARAVLAVLGER